MSRSRGGDDDGGFRVTIPSQVRSLIQSIRETTGKQHSDEEIYSVLQECSMDPDESAQKLLYLDTFHEVKKKRDRKKEGQGTRGGRGTYYSNHSSSVGRSGRNAAPQRENGANPLTERGAVLRKTKNNAVPHVTKASTSIANGPSSLSNGSFNNEHDPQSTVDGVVPEPENTTVVDSKKLGTEPLLPTPSLASIVGVVHEKSTSSYNHLPTSPSSVSVIYSSTSDQILTSPLSCNTGAVGTIVLEVGSKQKAAHPNHIQVNEEFSYDVDKESSMSEKEASNTSNSIQEEKIDSISEEVKNDQLSKLLESSSLTTEELATHSSVNDSLPAEESVAPPKVVTSGDVTVAITSNSQLLPESTVSNYQHVTFPNHFKVSEAVKRGLTFGSIDASFGISTNYVNDTSCEINSAAATDSIHGHDEIAGESSAASSQSIPSTTEVEALDHQQTTPVVDEVPSSAGTVLNGTELKHYESKQEMMPLLSEGHQKPAILSVPNYSYGFMLPSPGSQLVQMEGLKAQSHDASLISNFANGNSLVPSSSPAPSVESSVAAPLTVQYFRHPYPSFLSYGQYLSPYFMPNLHQYLSPNGLPQQPLTGNIYLSSAAGAAGVKFPLSQFKAGTHTGNPPHIGISPGFGSFSSSVGFNPITAGTSGKSTSNEDLAASQLKENHIYPTRPLSDGSGVWTPALGQDLSNMQLNSLYNLTIQGQYIPFTPQTRHGAFPGVYQPAQTLAAPSNANPLLQQTQAVSAAVDNMPPPSGGAYLQPELAQMTWNPSY